LNNFKDAQRIVIKVGTSTLTHETGRINIRRMERFVKVLADIANSGRQLILVTSGAIGVGRGKLGVRERPADVPAKQAFAAIGQSEIMYFYDKTFGVYNHTVAQVLLTKNVVDDPHGRQNVINTLEKLLQMGVIPIINENDTVAIDELEGNNYGDNDTLSAIVAGLVDANALVIISDIEGLFDKNPRKYADATLIPLVEKIDDNIRAMASGSGSNRGTGGMITKIQAAEIAVEQGIPMAIIGGEMPARLYDLLEGKPVGTYFQP